MLTILSLLTGGGAIGALIWFIPGLRALSGKLIAAIPPKVAWALLAVAALAALVFWHNHSVGKAYDRGRAEERVSRDAQWQAAFNQMRDGAAIWKDNYEREAARSAELTGAIHAQDLRHNAALADALRLRGPGKAAAACHRSGSDTGLSAATGGSDAPAAGQLPELAGLPDQHGPLAALPWPELIEWGRSADDSAAEVKAWRDWYKNQRALHEDAVKRLRERMAAVKMGFEK